ncbi:MAG: DUF1861 family protein [Defluviitaleaceae bacterium]|nr:DUF1861 family protein [Defluviitaleaceae bacterium]
MRPSPRSIGGAYEEFLANRNIRESEILTFEYPDMDVYNPSVPFVSDGIEVIAGRVHGRMGRDSTTVFFTKAGGVYKPIADAPTFPLEDPFITYINGEIILGGVYVDWEGERAKSWRTLLYRGTSIYNLKHFLDGPDHMKDIRLCQLPSGSVAVCSRPQGEKVIAKYGCIAKIGFTIVPSLDDLTAEIIDNAPHIQDVFPPDEWGGANQLHSLTDGKIGVIGHISQRKPLDGIDFLHYYSVAFTIDTESLKTSSPKVICSRSCFPGNESREPRLYDVTFCAGISPKDDKDVYIYSGLSDCQIGRAVIPNPFNIY